MANKPLRLVIDTNIFIYFLISDSFHLLDKKIKHNNIKLLLSEELLFEFLQVVRRPKFTKYFSEKDVTILLNNLHECADLIEVRSRVNIYRDKKDNFLLALCVDGKADFLITGDEDLLVLKTFKTTSILKMSDYLKSIKYT
ncbi:MAG: putative toxin-antitoxin system toxin component, PIN family [Bacteroidetes bacterium]|nr:putative toxin-antitoxin system toxin component, PIN family [Bacteroidota bacterium]